MRGTKAKMLRRLARSLTTEPPSMEGGSFRVVGKSDNGKPLVVGVPLRHAKGTFRRWLGILKSGYGKMIVDSRRQA